MPNITQFTSQVDQLRPQEGGAEAFAQEGRRVGAFYHQMGQDVGSTIKGLGDEYEAHQTFQEVSKLAATGSTLHNSLDQALQTAFKDPDAAQNPAVAQHFQQDVLEPALQNYIAAAQTKGGKEFALEHANQLRQFFNEKAVATQSTVEGNDLVSNLETANNQASYSARLDPSSGDLVRGTYRASTEALIAAHPGMSADQVSAIRAHANEGLAKITLSQGMGMADNNPAEAKKQFAAGGAFSNYLDAAQQEELNRYADNVVRTRQEQDKAATALARTQLEDEGKSMVSQLRASGMGDDGVFRATPQIIEATRLAATKYGSVIPGEISALQGAIQESTKNKLDRTFATTNPQTWSNLMAGVGKPAGTPGAITSADVDRAYAAGQLSDHDYSKAHEMIEHAGRDPSVAETQRRVNELFTSVKPQIGKTDAFGGLLDADASQNFYRYQSAVQDTIDNLRAQGKNETEIQQDLLDPRGSHYAGAPATLKNYTIVTQASASLAAARARVTAQAGGQQPAGGGKPALTADEQAWVNSHK